jgi:preprotein translocase subunit SecD
MACFLAVLQQAGSAQPDTVSARVSVHLESGANQATIGESQRILLERLTAFLPDRNSRISASIVRDVLQFDFRGLSPGEQELKFLCESRGVLRLALVDTPRISWISDMDVEEVQLYKERDGFFMRVRLTAAAGARLTQLTQKNIGRAVRYTWDGEYLFDATINSVLGRQFRFSAPPPPRGLMMRAILQHGRLPVGVAKCLVQISPNISGRTREG